MKDKSNILLISVIVGIVVYAAIFILTTSFGNYGMPHMGYRGQGFFVNVLVLLIAVLAGYFAYNYLEENGKKKPVERGKYDGFDFVKKTLSDDERKVVKEIEKSEEITQDSLRLRLGWSKAKLSSILTRLDKLNVIQRKREGKTYNLFLSKKFRSVQNRSGSKK